MKIAPVKIGLVGICLNVVRCTLHYMLDCYREHFNYTKTLGGSNPLTKDYMDNVTSIPTDHIINVSSYHGDSYYLILVSLMV